MFQPRKPHNPHAVQLGMIHQRAYWLEYQKRLRPHDDRMASAKRKGYVMPVEAFASIEGDV